jgi:5-enolpyruvylshikimate-3-phosphate synthase
LHGIGQYKENKRINKIKTKLQKVGHHIKTAKKMKIKKRKKRKEGKQ